MRDGRRRLRVALLAALLGLAAGRAEAADVYVKLHSMTVEMWDAAGLFHQIIIDLTVAFPEQSKLNKAVVYKIQQALQSLPYEELVKPSGAATIKATAMDIISKEPGGEQAEDVLIQRLMFR